MKDELSLGHHRFLVRVDGVEVDEHSSEPAALAAARDLKRDLEEQLVTVWNVTAGTAQIIEV